jgi:predicted Zn-dependent protease
VYLKLNKLDQAAEVLHNAIKINENWYLPQLNLGVVLNRQGKHKEAAGLLVKLLSDHPDQTKIHLPLIEALIGAQQWQEAEEELNRAVPLKGADVVDLKIKLGMVMIKQGKSGAAVDILYEASRAEPDNALAQFSLGTALLQIGSLDPAETALRRAYEIKGSQMPGAQLLLGELYFQKKDYSKAIEAFKAYLRDLPTAPNAAQVKEAIDRLRQAAAKQ